jgi:hypothetical protein
VDDLFGQPEMVMNAGQAQWWRYALSSCAIDVFLIGRNGAEDMVVSHVSVRTTSGALALDTQSCQQLDARLSQTARAEAELPAVQSH